MDDTITKEVADIPLEPEQVVMSVSESLPEEETSQEEALQEESSEGEINLQSVEADDLTTDDQPEEIQEPVLEAFEPEQEELVIELPEQIQPEKVDLENAGSEEPIETQELKVQSENIEPLVEPSFGILAINDYPIDADAVLLTLSGTSTNDHTWPRYLWTYDDVIYVAVEGTQTGLTMSLPNGSSTGETNHPKRDSISVDGTTLNLLPHPNRHWIVFTFNKSALNLADPIQPYTVTMQGGGHSVTGSFTIQIPKVTITVNKTWVNGPMTPVTISPERRVPGGQWLDVPEMDRQLTAVGGEATTTWNDLAYVDNTGKIYEYRIVEAVPGEGYDVTHETPIYNDKTYTYTFTLTNTYTSPLIDVTATKVWKNGPISEEVELQLLRDGEAYGDAVMTDELMYTWPDLDETDEWGVAYEYTVEEPVVPANYVAVVTGDQTHGFMVTNTYTSPLIDVTATKVWVSGPPVKPVIQLQLYRDGEAYGEVVELDGVTSYTWQDLDKTDAEGKEYVYTVQETIVPNDYEVSYSEDGLTVTNTWIKAELPTTGKTELPKTGMGSSIPILITGIALLVVTLYLGLKHRNGD